MWRHPEAYRDTWLSGFNHKREPVTITIRVVPDRQAEQTIVVPVAPRSRWAINLADPAYKILREGEVVNIGGDLETQGTVPMIAIWNRPSYGAGAMDDSDPLPSICQ